MRTSRYSTLSLGLVLFSFNGVAASSTLRGLTGKSADEIEMDKLRDQWGISGSDFKAAYANFGDLWEPFDNRKDTPFFFMIPKSGTSTFQDYLGLCTQLPIASHLGGEHENDKLEVITKGDRQYLNINPESRAGLYHAQKVKLAESAKAGVLISQYVHQVASMFNTHNQARWFTLMRNPLERTSSEFYYIQVAEWEPKAYKPWLKNWTLSQYVNSDLFVDNWMTRQIVGKSRKSIPLTREDLENAKRLMSRKLLIGLIDEYEESLKRFRAYFGWVRDDACMDRLFHGENGGKRNSNSHPHLKRGSAEWKAVVQKHLFDMELYTHALELFQKQKNLFFGDRAIAEGKEADK